MGLDWLAFTEEDGVWRPAGSFRGKGVAYDKNIEETDDIAEKCYGDGESHWAIGLPYIPENWKLEIIAEIESILEAEKEGIALMIEAEVGGEPTEEDYAEWRSFMEEARDFLKKHKMIFCWY
jgi:hypothetical protein